MTNKNVARVSRMSRSGGGVAVPRVQQSVVLHWVQSRRARWVRVQSACMCNKFTLRIALTEPYQHSLLCTLEIHTDWALRTRSSTRTRPNFHTHWPHRVRQRAVCLPDRRDSLCPPPLLHRRHYFTGVHPRQLRRCSRQCRPRRPWRPLQDQCRDRRIYPRQ